MRYAQGGGLTPREQDLRERVRLRAGESFERGERSAVIAKELRVSVRSVQRWRRVWRADGRQALLRSGPAKRPRLSAEDFAVLESELVRGTVAHGWPDEYWTLSRVQAVIEESSGVTMSVHGVWELLRRHGWSCQQPVRRALERDEQAVRGWVKETWPRAKPPRRPSEPG